MDSVSIGAAAHSQPALFGDDLTQPPSQPFANDGEVQGLTAMPIYAAENSCGDTEAGIITNYMIEPPVDEPLQLSMSNP